MGLGIITGAIAIARTATMSEIKAEDLSWRGVPNAMTRVFEVNIGNIAACMPILKPFARYVGARITGRDPHGILRMKEGEGMQQERWYKCGVPVLSLPWSRERDYGSSGQQGGEDSLPPNVVKMRTVGLEERSMGSGTTKTASIALPMQGIRKGESDESTPDIPDIRDSHYFRSRSDDNTDSGEYFGAKDVV